MAARSLSYTKIKTYRAERRIASFGSASSIWEVSLRTGRLLLKSFSWDRVKLIGESFASPAGFALLIDAEDAVSVQVHLVEIGEWPRAKLSSADLLVLVRIEPRNRFGGIRLGPLRDGRAGIELGGAELAVPVGVELAEQFGAALDEQGFDRLLGTGLGGLYFGLADAAVIVGVELLVIVVEVADEIGSRDRAWCVRGRRRRGGPTEHRICRGKGLGVGDRCHADNREAREEDLKLTVRHEISPVG